MAHPQKAPAHVSPADKKHILMALANYTGTMITDRLLKLKPELHLENHIVFTKKLEVGPTILDGVSFEPVDSGALRNLISEALDFTGKKAFTDPEAVEHDHWPLKLSFLATEGTGFREVGRAFLTEPIRLYDRQPWERPQMDLGFGSQFGTTSIKLDVSSLHWAVSPRICSVHIDHSGFTMQLDTGVAVGPNMIQHILDELLLKDKFVKLMPKWAGSTIRRITFIYPNTANGFSRWGPRIDATPILKKIAELPSVGGIIGRAHLPGVNIELLRGSNYKLSYTFSCGVRDGGCSHTLNLEGVF